MHGLGSPRASLTGDQRTSLRGFAAPRYRSAPHFLMLSLCGPYPPHYRAAFACSGSPLPPPPSPFLAVGLPSCDGTSGAYPVARGGVTTGAAAPCRPAGVDVTVASSAIWRSDPLTFWSRPPASWACFTVTDFRRAFACAQPSGLR